MGYNEWCSARSTWFGRSARNARRSGCREGRDCEKPRAREDAKNSSQAGRSLEVEERFDFIIVLTPNYFSLHFHPTLVMKSGLL